MNNERWVPVLGFEGCYEASSLGRIRSLHRNLILKPAISKGYYIVVLHDNKRKRTARVHRFILESFTGERRPDSSGYHAAHKNGDCFDNRIENLYWATHSENAQDKFRHGTFPMGEKHKRSKLTAAQVLEIYRRAIAGGSLTRLAREFGVSDNTIWEIKKKRTWKHLLANKQESKD